MSIKDRLARVNQRMTEPGAEDSWSQDGPQSQTLDPWFEFDNEVRSYILNTLAAFVSTGDALSNTLFGVLRRVLGKATHEDLQNVILETSGFIDGLRAKGLVLEAGEYLAALPGPSAPHWDEPGGKVNPGEVSPTELLQGHAETEDDTGYKHPSERNQGEESNPEGAGDRHQTQVAGDTDSDRQEHPQSLSEDGTGGPVASNDPDETL